MKIRYQIAVAGAGYVGLANAVLLAQNHSVTITDMICDKVACINAGKSPIADREISEYLGRKDRSLWATTDAAGAYRDADYVVIATPTNYDPEQDGFDTASVETVIGQVLEVNDRAVIVIKSTVPVGYTESLCKHYQTDRILFSPEFLREGRALYDNLHPSRIIVGAASGDARKYAAAFASLMLQETIEKNAPVLYMRAAEAEAVKLFANTYLAMRIAFFNELDTYAETKGVSTRAIIDGICLDPRIGGYYNNPSFGYGGYCLPKDTRQLLSNYREIPNSIMGAIVEANITRKAHVAKRILERTDSNSTVGIYRLAMKSNSDNFRQSAILDIIKQLRSGGAKVVIYEPAVNEKKIFDCRVVNDLEYFKRISDIIVANRRGKELEDVADKVYSRDIYARD